MRAILGKGKRWFDGASTPRTWAVTRTRQSESGVIANTYERTVHPPRTGTFGEIEPGEAELARRERWAREERV